MEIRRKYDGTYKQRKDGRWEFRVMEGYTEDGKQNRRSFYGSTPTEERKKRSNTTQRLRKSQNLRNPLP